MWLSNASSGVQEQSSTIRLSSSHSTLASFPTVLHLAVGTHIRGGFSNISPLPDHVRRCRRFRLLQAKQTNLYSKLPTGKFETSKSPVQFS
ncbi:hypothetical protein MPTK2_3g13990 [Marchantia polymorpha subsp. ruderalis]